ncbi:MAG: hypothetical protein AAGD92_16535 [Pseudomonadota bacterium]
MKVGKPAIDIENDEMVISAPVEWNGGKDRIWFRCDKKFAPMASPRSDAFLLAMLIPAMYRGEDLHVEGDVSPKLLVTTRGDFQEICRLSMHELKRISVYADSISVKASLADGVMASFSGGIDSYCTIIDYFAHPPCAEFKITHLAFNNLNGHGKKGGPVFDQRRRDVMVCAERLGLPVISFASNIEDFFPPGRYAHSHPVRHQAAAMTLQRGIGRFLFSSGLYFTDVRVRPNRSMNFAECLLTSFMSTESFEMMVVGNQYTRVQKTLKIGEYEPSHDTLDVCVTPFQRRAARNCGKCAKCVRTLLTLDIAGYLPAFERNFDMPQYRSARLREIAKAALANDPFIREIAQLAEEKNYAFSTQEKAALKLTQAPLIGPLAQYAYRQSQNLRGLEIERRP